MGLEECNYPIREGENVEAFTLAAGRSYPFRLDITCIEGEWCVSFFLTHS